MGRNEKIVIDNPPRKVLDFIEKMRQEKEAKKTILLEKKTHTFSIQV